VHCGVLVPVGPSAGELARVQDLLESLRHYETAVSCIVLVDDAPSSRDLTKSANVNWCELVCVVNPRQGRGDGWAGGLCVGIMAGLRWFWQNRPDLEFVLKMDTDALCIGPFAQKICARFRGSPELGLVGTHRVNPDGKPRKFSSWAPSIRTYLRPVCLRGRNLQITFWGRPARIKRTLLAALKNGYEISEHCQGGAYAVSMEALGRMSSEGHFVDPMTWLKAGLGEDVMMGLCVRSVGKDMQDYNGAGEPFAVQHIGLPDSPANLVSRGYSIIHSIKDCESTREHEVRSFFQTLRSGSSTSVDSYK
jgi:hypothetical protein